MQRAKQVLQAFKVEMRELPREAAATYDAKAKAHHETLQKLHGDLQWAKVRVRLETLTLTLPLPLTLTLTLTLLTLTLTPNQGRGLGGGRRRDPHALRRSDGPRAPPG